MPITGREGRETARTGGREGTTRARMTIVDRTCRPDRADEEAAKERCETYVRVMCVLRTAGMSERVRPPTYRRATYQLPTRTVPTTRT